ncbi:hypothetical protein [Paenisporosarcina sp. TG20]|uniref:hypothetical protein n=1 Tax=Paenisporosarcina sp. TG20 TaxID=1211706 RepID=UPI0002EFF571|nr:hypothetical protein [Paenisporosarcina sp. TG20]
MDRKWTASGSQVDHKWVTSGSQVDHKWTASGQTISLDGATYKINGNLKLHLDA